MQVNGWGPGRVPNMRTWWAENRQLLANAAIAASRVGGKRLHFHEIPEEVNASIPASAHSTSCSSVAPATPTAPSTWPARMMGRPPGLPMSGAPSPMTVAARKYSEPSIDLSPLGRPDLAETNAFPIDARLASASAPSIRWRAMRRPSASQTLTLMLTARLCALARAAWMARFASASLIDMSFAWMDRFEYCVLAFLALLPVFHNNTCRRRPLRCGISTGPMSAQGQKRTSRRQVDHVRFTPESRQRADMP